MSKQHYRYPAPDPSEPDYETLRYYDEEDPAYQPRHLSPPRYPEAEPFRGQYGPDEAYGEYEEYDEYEDDEYEDDEYEDEPEYVPPPPPPKKRKKRRRRRRGAGMRRLAFFLIALIFVYILAGKMPSREGNIAPRTQPVCNLLLAGTDADGIRTDTILLLSMEYKTRSLRLVSIPRDTYAPDYEVPKINSAYGAAGGGNAGMEALMRQAEKVLGFAPDGYVLVKLSVFMDAVDLLGGVDFDVPMDMYYVDPDQDLLIDLHAGMQHLDGEKAMELVRFRSGYANADIGRTSVQRDFLRAALKQWMSVRSLAALPELWDLYNEDVITDLDIRELLWLSRIFLKADLGGMEADVLPGWSAMMGNASCYVIDDAAAAPLLRSCSPYV